MKRRLGCYKRGLLLSVCLLPLLAVGPCLSIAYGAAITGLFNALTPLLVEGLKEYLGA